MCFLQGCSPEQSPGKLYQMQGDLCAAAFQKMRLPQKPLTIIPQRFHNVKHNFQIFYSFDFFTYSFIYSFILPVLSWSKTYFVLGLTKFDEPRFSSLYLGISCM